MPSSNIPASSFSRPLPDSPERADGPAGARHAALFRNGRNQAVRIPREFEMEGSEVLIRREGERLILSPVRRHPLKDLLASWAPMPDALPEIADLPLQERDSL